MERERSRQLCVRSTGEAIIAFTVRAKGGLKKVKRILEFINCLGHQKISIKFDNERATKRLREEMIAQRKKSTIPSGSVQYHPHIQGIAEIRSPRLHESAEKDQDRPREQDW